MTLAEWLVYVQSGGSICAPLLLIALLWMNSERKEAISKCEKSEEKLQNLSEKTIILLTEIKSLFGSRSL